MAPRLVKDGGNRGDGDHGRFADEALALNDELVKAVRAAGDGDVDERVVWGIYARTEKLVAVLKFRLGYETPGVFAELPKADKPLALLEDAAALLSSSAEAISKRRLADSVGLLRGARNDLRAYLADKKRAELRAEREARKKRASKAP